MKPRWLLLVLLAALSCGCVTHIRPTVNYNPPPSEPLSHFQHFMLAPLKVSGGAAHEEAAVNKISLYMRQRVGGTLMSWENRNQSGRVLEVKPCIDQLKFVGGGTRFFAGALAGSSAVLMHVALVDAQTGRMIANPEFYQRAAAYGGAWSFGGTDNGMLARIATVVQQYLDRNYLRAVGGPTGLDGTEQD
ncbi:MAG TPA: hypothetical protein VFX04_10355 [Rhodanobacteraceae bacterium]|jgi:hypothetical protein|nr:hypothetical protein [Rhodanobacteraceae bacterium]